jgi:outer membrane usher protein
VLTLAFFILFTFFLPPMADGGQPAILKIVLNQEEKGEFLVNVADDGDFLLRSEDLKKIGFTDLKGKISTIEKEEFISLKSVEGVKFDFNEKKLFLEITADPNLLGKKIFILHYTRQGNVYYPKGTSAFLNYNLTYFAGESFKYNQTVLTNQLGFRVWDLLFLTDSSTTQKRGENPEFVRLMSSITYDRREDMTRGIVGDFFVTSGELGSSLNMGGISYSKNFKIDPYFIAYPEVNFSGLASLPSEIEVYRDGILIRREKISPGSFQLKDIPTYAGSGLVEIVMKDAFGREQRIKMPYYLSENLLKKGLHEYSYNLGYQREDYGIESNQYKELSFLGFHRYGFSDSLTAGIRGEASEKLLNFGISSTLLLPWDLGVVNGAVAWSNSRERNVNGSAGSMGYFYQGREFSFFSLVRGFSRDYTSLFVETQKEKPKFEASAGAGYSSRLFGSLSVGFTDSEKYVGTNTKNLFASYSRNITDCSVITATFKRDLEANTTEFMLGLNYYFNYGITASASYQKKDKISSERIQILKNLPVGEGFGGRASFERNQAEEENFNSYDLQLQYNGRYGQYSGEIASINRMEAYTLSAGGALTFVKDSFNITRPVQDSFGLVKVGDLKGVRVYLNNQEIGKTGKSGKVLVPDMSSYYENQVSIRASDLPMEYLVTDVMRYVSPPLRSGSFIEFGATKIQSIIGMLKVRVKEETKPAEYIEFKMIVDGKELLSPTGKGGEIYLENIKPGKYRGEFKYLDKAYTFDIIIPKSDEMLIDLGEIICE